MSNKKVSDLSPCDDVPNGSEPRIAWGGGWELVMIFATKHWINDVTPPACSSHSKPGLFVSDVKTGVYLLCNMHLVFSEEKSEGSFREGLEWGSIPVNEPCFWLSVGPGLSYMQDMIKNTPAHPLCSATAIRLHYEGGSATAQQTMTVCGPGLFCLWS